MRKCINIWKQQCDYIKKNKNNAIKQNIQDI